MISVVIETFNLDSAGPAPLERVVAALAPQLRALRAELVITTTGVRSQFLAHPARWIALPAGAGYYDHKNLGFAASTGDIVAFLDGDCDPASDWLHALVTPIARGRAAVVAGATSYPGKLARLANELDFPYFDARGRRYGAGKDVPQVVRNFFANNVAFTRGVFTRHPYPSAPMFHGQCQLLALALAAAGIAIHHAPAAQVTHAWPDGIREWLTVRLLRGADCASLIPHVVAAEAPRAAPAIKKLGAVPALAVLGARGVLGALAALRRGPRLRGLALVAGVTAVDAIGAAARATVYRRFEIVGSAAATAAPAADPVHRTADIAA